MAFQPEGLCLILEHQYKSSHANYEEPQHKQRQCLEFEVIPYNLLLELYNLKQIQTN